MLISVIMANYNGAKYLSDAIESVIAQDYNNFEFIIIDDGSTDGSREIIEKYHRLYKGKIKPVYRSENMGQGACFNIGIKRSSAEILFVFWTVMTFGSKTNFKMYTMRIPQKANLLFTSIIFF